MLCKKTTSRNGVTCIRKDDHKSKLSCILEADETRRLRVEGIEKRIHEDHIAGKGDNSRHHYNLEHECIPMPQAMKIQRMEKSKAQRCESTFRTVDGHLSSEEF